MNDCSSNINRQAQSLEDRKVSSNRPLQEGIEISKRGLLKHEDWQDLVIGCDVPAYALQLDNVRMPPKLAEYGDLIDESLEVGCLPRLPPQLVLNAFKGKTRLRVD